MDDLFSSTVADSLLLAPVFISVEDIVTTVSPLTGDLNGEAHHGVCCYSAQYQLTSRFKDNQTVLTVTIHDKTVLSNKVLTRCGSYENQLHLYRLHEDVNNSSATLQVSLAFFSRVTWIAVAAVRVIIVITRKIQSSDIVVVILVVWGCAIFRRRWNFNIGKVVVLIVVVSEFVGSGFIVWLGGQGCCGLNNVTFNAFDIIVGFAVLSVGG